MLYPILIILLPNLRFRMYVRRYTMENYILRSIKTPSKLCHHAGTNICRILAAVGCSDTIQSVLDIQRDFMYYTSCTIPYQFAIPDGFKALVSQVSFKIAITVAVLYSFLDS